MPPEGREEGLLLDDIVGGLLSALAHETDFDPLIIEGLRALADSGQLDDKDAVTRVLGGDGSERDA